MIRRTVFIAVVGLALGCSYVPTTRLEYTPVIGNDGPVPLTLAVEPLKEDRPPRYYPSYAGRLYLTYVPLLPWVKIPFERLDESYLKVHETSEPWSNDPEHFTRKISESIAEDLRRSNLFRDVRLVDGRDASNDADFTLGGKLRSTEFDAYASSYCLGMAGVLLWLLPIPVGRDAATVEIDLELKDRAGTVVWSERASGRAGKYFWLYSTPPSKVSRFGLEIYRYGSNNEGIDPNSLWAYHAAALRKGMATAKRSLSVALQHASERPPVAVEPSN